jgi:hypothetical protein
VILENVKSITRGLIALERNVATQRVRVYKLPNQIHGRAIIPMQFFPPMAGLLLEQRFQSA